MLLLLTDSPRHRLCAAIADRNAVHYPPWRWCASAARTRRQPQPRVASLGHRRGTCHARRVGVARVPQAVQVVRHWVGVAVCACSCSCACACARLSIHAMYKLDANTMSRLMAWDACSILRYNTGSPKMRAEFRTCSTHHREQGMKVVMTHSGTKGRRAAGCINAITDSAQRRRRRATTIQAVLAHLAARFVEAGHGANDEALVHRC